MKRVFELNQPSFHALVICAAASLALLASPSAWSQWQWQDAQGRKVFSDQPPPAGIPDAQILKRPSRISVLPVADKPAADNPQPKPTPVKSDKESDLDRKAREAKAKEATDQQAQKQKQAQEVAENCERAQRSVRTIESGTRMSTTNDKGEREVMDEQARHAELERTQSYIRANCNR